jgi:hypothetical protein
VYAPGAEMDVGLRILFNNPALLLGANLDNYRRNESVVASTNSARHDRKHANLDESKEKHDTHQNHHQADVENNHQIFETFITDHENIKLPNLDMKDFPFYEQHFYYRHP